MSTTAYDRPKGANNPQKMSQIGANYSDFMDEFRRRFLRFAPENDRRHRAFCQNVLLLLGLTIFTFGPV